MILYLYLICAFVNLVFSIVCMYQYYKPLDKSDFITTMVLVLLGPIGTLVIIVVSIIVSINERNKNGWGSPVRWLFE